VIWIKQGTLGYIAIHRNAGQGLFSNVGLISRKRIGQRQERNKRTRSPDAPAAYQAYKTTLPCPQLLGRLNDYTKP